MGALVVANWKMNGALPQIESFGERWNALSSQAPVNVTTVVCPPHPYLAAVLTTLSGIDLGGQDCSAHSAGAYTGEVAADMLAEAGCEWVIVGHSERRRDHAETDALIAAKAAAAVTAGLTAIVCVGESLAQREAGEAEAVVAAQLSESLDGLSADGFVVAYEPVWAIGTGVTATPEQAGAMHGMIKDWLIQRFGSAGEHVAVLYGGSVTPETASELFALDTVDGALVGGASLDADSFWAIVSAANEGRT